MIDELKEQLKQIDSLPFLFVGSGFSKRYLDLPTWKELLQAIASLVNPDKFYFAKLERITADKYDINKDYNAYMTFLCDLISDDLNKIWYDDEKFNNSRIEYGDLVLEQNTAPLKIEISKYITSFIDTAENKRDELEELQRISSHSISGFITTNYDNLLENHFNYTTYNSQEELLFRTSYEIGEIYKIHGSVNDPHTILINSADYQQIKDKDKYIAAKLLTIFIEHPIIFIGYSIGDEDILNILKSILDCLNEEQKSILESRLIFISWNSEIEGYKIATNQLSFENGNVLSIKQYEINDFSILYRTICENKSKLPVQALRKLKQSMYTLALTTDKSTKILVQNPEKIIESDDYEIIAGFGIMDLAKRGYKSITAVEIFKDVINGNENFNYEYLVKETLPKLIRSVNGSLPFYKYIQGLDESEIPESLQAYKKNNLNQFKARSWRNATITEKSISEIIEGSDTIESKVIKIPKLKVEEIDVDELGKFIASILEADETILDTAKNPYKSNLRRLIKIYDWLKYK